MGERLREIGQELRRLRLAAGLSGVGLASRAGVPQSTVSRVETGRVGAGNSATSCDLGFLVW
jgi:transcriptional regulator with XRE-family HTH domain